MLNISVCCVTYNRPHLLGELIQSFLMQTYPASHRELIILDDAGQYENVRGDRWQLVSIPRRFASLGEKRNACFSLASPDTDLFVITDDDDIYLPWWLETHAKKFEGDAKWACEKWCYLSKENEIVSKMFYSSHPSHAYDRKTFLDSGGYPPVSGWEDRDFHGKLRKMSISCDDSCGERSFLIYRRFSSERHLTCVSVEVYRNPKKFSPILPRADLEIGWRRDYLADVERFEKNKRSQ